MGVLRRRRARRDLERRMRELDRLDARHGLGAMPRRRPRRSSGRPRLTAWLLAVAVTVGAGAALAFSPSEPGSAFRRLTGINRPHRLLPTRPTDGPSGGYAFVRTLPSGDPVTYDPCKAIHYVVNPAGGPADQLVFIQAAVRRAEAASGLRFVFDGTSEETWDSRSRAFRRRPVLITFNRPEEVAQLGGAAVGLGGSVAFGLEGRTPRYVTGSIALDSEWFLEASARRRTPQERSVVMHELGHVIGLGHVDDPSQLMYADDVGQLDYGPGDLAGLARLGAGPCE